MEIKSRYTKENASDAPDMSENVRKFYIAFKYDHFEFKEEYGYSMCQGSHKPILGAILSFYVNLGRLGFMMSPGA